MVWFQIYRKLVGMTINESPGVAFPPRGPPESSSLCAFFFFSPPFLRSVGVSFTDGFE